MKTIHCATGPDVIPDKLANERLKRILKRVKRVLSKETKVKVEPKDTVILILRNGGERLLTGAEVAGVEVAGAGAKRAKKRMLTQARNLRTAMITPRMLRTDY